MAKDLTDIKKAATSPTGMFSFNTPTSNASRVPSYALAASKHAPRLTAATSNAPQVFRPTLHKKTPPPPPPALKTGNTITIAQRDREGKELSTLNYPTLIAMINKKLTEANVKGVKADQKAIQIRSVHRHPSNNLVLYTTTPQQADALRRQGDQWIPLFSPRLQLNNPVHTVVVHSIPTSFQPADPQHLDMLTAMNADTMVPAPTFVKWVSLSVIQRGVLHSLIHIGFQDADQARRAVEQKIF